jgi:hypothetical protein
VEILDRRLAERYPRLTEAERAGIMGYARARIWVAGEEGLFVGENEDVAIARAAERTAEHAIGIVRLRHASASVDDLRGLMADLLEMDDELIARLFEETLPGLGLGVNTKVYYRLRLPGRVTTTNAAARDGDTLAWDFSPFDHLLRPLELYAEAVIGG